MQSRESVSFLSEYYSDPHTGEVQTGLGLSWSSRTKKGEGGPAFPDSPVNCLVICLVPASTLLPQEPLPAAGSGGVGGIVPCLFSRSCLGRENFP